MGLTHGRILKSDPRVRLAALFDQDPQRLESAGRLLEAPVVGSSQQLLESVDAVYITIPNSLHVEAALSALAAGKHVFCEKPFATTLADAERLLGACRAARLKFQVGHNRRFAPVYQKVKQLLDGQFQPTLAHFKMNRGDLHTPAYVGDSRLTGGYLYETPLHLFDMAAWLFGSPQEIRGVGAQRTVEEADNFSFIFQFESGLSLTFASCAHSGWFFPFERIEVFGKGATLETQEMERLSWALEERGVATTEDFGRLPSEVRWGYVGINANFVGALLDECEVGVGPDQGHLSVKMVHDCYRACGL